MARAKSSKSTSTKSEKAVASAVEQGQQAAPEEPATPSTLSNSKPESDHQIRLKVSESLYQRVKFQAEDEGISINEFLIELISEGVVLRAWEILEKKATMRGATNSHQSFNGSGNGNHRHGNNHHRRNFNNQNNHRRGGLNNQRYQNIMEDKASFLEYVRNQEKQQGR